MVRQHLVEILHDHHDHDDSSERRHDTGIQPKREIFSVLFYQQRKVHSDPCCYITILSHLFPIILYLTRLSIPFPFVYAMLS